MGQLTFTYWSGAQLAVVCPRVCMSAVCPSAVYTCVCVLQCTQQCSVPSPLSLFGYFPPKSAVLIGLASQPICFLPFFRVEKGEVLGPSTLDSDRCSSTWTTL